MEKSIRLLALVLLLVGSLSSSSGRSEQVIPAIEVITTDRLPELMTGEWMVEFYAPWCPACNQFADTWEQFAEWVSGERSLGLRVGKVDVTVETMLSGQFMVTHLPSIFHIREGEVRVYQMSRSYSDLVEYIEEKKWTKVDEIPWWRSPIASHMKAIGIVFWLSEQAKVLQERLEKDYQLPTYAVFVIIAIATIVVGLVLGGLTVCCIEVCMRLCSRSKPHPHERREMPRPAETKASIKTEEKPPVPVAAATEATPTKKESSGSGARQRKTKSKKNKQEAKD